MNLGARKSSGIPAKLDHEDMMSKIDELRCLERDGIVEEMVPYPGYWHFKVIRPLDLPDKFRDEYLRLGEIRWFGLEEM